MAIALTWRTSACAASGAMRTLSRPQVIASVCCRQARSRKNIPNHAAAAVEPIRRLVCCCTTLGIHAENLIPKEAGREFEQTPYLEPLQEIRHEVTVISGTSHPDVDGGHASEASFLTAAPHPGASSFRNTISLDQYVVEKLPPATRYSHLVLSTGGGSGLSVSRSGVKLPADSRPSELFKKLFVSGTLENVKPSVSLKPSAENASSSVSGVFRMMVTQVPATTRRTGIGATRMAIRIVPRISEKTAQNPAS